MSNVDYDFPEPPNPDIEAEVWNNLRLVRSVKNLQAANAKLEERVEAIENYNAHQLIKMQALLERVEALEKQQEAIQYAEIHKGSLEPPRRQYS